ncbi:HAD family hydrolase [Pedobacter antarcticus]|uniref:Haloacid dehalogenase n=2 Tax=Pedobacter antarcticus TaxID=34086 RepID=A0A081PIS4_9SPHI|nr:HAD family phosphatase [Pedobacter antarcticus]KEQ30597.1 haloacid dehalogenase [Pedobacter antarcticus 4BY]SDM30822.1 haloacid dehalogenase superfamily, subfamily IA, variant 3 with third motif having DD or ED [Pedobacter antarcticus]SFF18687.1 haloacid dehalogenase superfamily, subfamily IA, variant 3 with third motif having DD or ED [Pedobacter antarcticus]
MNQNSAVIFDMDGVICHTNPYHSLAFREFFLKRELQPTDEDFAQHMFGKSNSYILSHFLQRPVTGQELLELEDEKESLFRKIYEPHIDPIAGIVSFMDDLAAHNFKLGVATSAPYANLELILSKVEIRAKMGSILSSEDVKKHKPDPEVYLLSAKNLNVDPENCIVFEDSFSGVSAALNAGMKVVGVLTSHTREELPPCQLYIKDYSALKASDIIAIL